MDHDAERSISSTASVNSLCVSTCTLSFQDFQSIQQLYAALTKHALKSTGTQIKYNSHIGLVSPSFPARASDVIAEGPGSALLPPRLHRGHEQFSSFSRKMSKFMPPCSATSITNSHSGRLPVVSFCNHRPLPSSQPQWTMPLSL